MKCQEHWDEIVRDPSLKDLPYKVETNEHGQIILSPDKNVHSDLQLEVAVLLRTLKPDGKASVEFAIATEKGESVSSATTNGTRRTPSRHFRRRFRRDAESRGSRRPERTPPQTRRAPRKVRGARFTCTETRAVSR